MTQTYRTNDLARWGTGKGSNLTPTEVDRNFWDIIQRLIAEEARPDPSAGIDFFSVSGTDFYVHMTDATVQGPYTLPYLLEHATGEWQPETSYAVLDTFTINGGLYDVIFAHTSDLTFDAGANDGLGHDYYSLKIQTPGSALPSGGAEFQVLQKSSSTDYAVMWGYKLPSGGNARDYLIKVSGTQDDAEWGPPQADDIEFTPVTGSDLVSDNVADALEELSTAVVDGASTTAALSELTDVLFATGEPIQGQLLYYDGVSWAATGIPGTSEDILTWSGTNWEPAPPTLAQLRWDTLTALGTSGIASLNPALGNVFTVTPTGTLQIDAASTPAAVEITIIITTSGTSSYNISFVTGFVSTGDLATGTSTNKRFVIKFISNGFQFHEVSRTVAMP